MALISTIGRKEGGARALLLIFYFLLCLGALTMIYPFLLMLAGSTWSGNDAIEKRLWPAFLTDDTALYRKHIEGLFDEDVAAMQKTYGVITHSQEEWTAPPFLDRAMAEAWKKFVEQSALPPETYALGYLEAPVSRTTPLMLGRFRKRLAQKFGADLDRINAALGTTFSDWASVQVLSEHSRFARQNAAASLLEQELREFKTTQSLGYRCYDPGRVQAQFGEFVRRNQVHSLWGESASVAQLSYHYFAFLDMRRELRWEFATRNYRTVIDDVLLRGRALLNTLIYCALAVLAALIVNPAAAYALSRWKGRASSRMLLWLIATMAFPPLLTQIPTFLLLRKLDLLNTFAALVLPGLANGYSIFLLKAFFDSLPRDLYESASLDGASEWQMFWQIAMGLSKPILAVNALGAFIAAYTNFMFAMLICQDPKMWTMSVWLYQLQQRNGPGVVYASLILAAIPMLVIFLCAQKVILRGIVIPSEG